MGEQRLNSRFPLQEKKTALGCLFLFALLQTTSRTKRPQAPLPGGGGVTIVPQTGLYHKGCLSAPYEHMSLGPPLVAISLA